MITISRLYDGYDSAARAVSDLERAGIAHNDISIIASNGEGSFDRDLNERPNERPSVRVDRDLDGTDDRVEGAATGAGIGAAVGGTAGLLAGLGMLAIPGLGPVVAAGWLASMAVVAVAGGATGGIIGALTQGGVPEEEANLYAEGLRRGGTLVTARVEDVDASRVTAIMDRSATDINQRATLWQRDGWTRFDPSAPAFTADEIRRERELYRTHV